MIEHRELNELLARLLGELPGNVPKSGPQQGFDRAAAHARIHDVRDLTIGDGRLDGWLLAPLA